MWKKRDAPAAFNEVNFEVNLQRIKGRPVDTTPPPEDLRGQQVNLRGGPGAQSCAEPDRYAATTGTWTNNNGPME